MRYTGPKVRKARRLGFAFTEKDTKILQKRNFAPGQHGQSRSRPSEYGIQLREKQKAKISYGVLERQFYKYFQTAQTQAGVTGQNLMRILESRLDNVVFRLGFAPTRAAARQLVNHGFFNVDGKKVDIASFQVKAGQVISVRETKAKSAYITQVKEKLKNTKTVDWLDLDASKLSGKVLSLPSGDQIETVINTQLIVEHYSRI